MSETTTKLYVIVLFILLVNVTVYAIKMVDLHSGASYEEGVNSEKEIFENSSFVESLNDVKPFGYAKINAVCIKIKESTAFSLQTLYFITPKEEYMSFTNKIINIDEMKIGSEVTLCVERTDISQETTQYDGIMIKFNPKPKPTHTFSLLSFFPSHRISRISYNVFHTKTHHKY